MALFQQGLDRRDEGPDDIMMPAETAIAPALLRRIETIEEENAVLRRHVVVQHSGFTDRKNQALRELMAAQRRDPGSCVMPHMRPHLERLSQALGENAQLLKLHITAVGEISDIIIGSLRDADSDGTYSRCNKLPGR